MQHRADSSILQGPRLVLKMDDVGLLSIALTGGKLNS